MAEHLAAGSMNDALRLAHGLKNSAGMIQAVEMAEIASDLELAIRDERLADIPKLFDLLKKENASTMIALAALLEA
jgi:HPt (histidine-containing phosphotransfer) domain-containing protein